MLAWAIVAATRDGLSLHAVGAAARAIGADYQVFRDTNGADEGGFTYSEFLLVLDRVTMQSQPKPVSVPDSEVDAEAQSYVHRLRKFYSLLGISVLVIALTATIDALTSPGHWWFGWVVFGMGIAIAFSAFDLFVTHRILGPGWERREIAKRIEKSRG